MSAPRWSRGPDTTAVNGVDYGGDAQQTGYAIADSAGRVYFITGGSTDTFLRLDPPYTRWFTMTPIQSGFGDGGEVRAEAGKLVLIGGGNVGSGAARYDPTLDAGYLAWFAGGGTDYSPWVKNWSFDPPNIILAAQEAWVYATSCQTPDGKNWVIGGGVLFGAGVNIVGSLTPGAGSWVRVTDMPGSPREGHSSCADNAGRIYVYGGNVVSDDQDEEATLYRYTPATDTWEALAQLTTPITGTDGLNRPVMVCDSLGLVYVLGGINNTGSIGTVFVYVPDVGWHQIADLPDGLVTTITGTAGESQPAFVVDDRIIVFAYASDLSASAVVAYDLKNGRWGKPIYTEVLHLRGGFTVTDTHAFILGGNDGGGNTSAVERIRVSDLAAFSGLHLASLSWRGEA